MGLDWCRALQGAPAFDSGQEKSPGAANSCQVELDILYRDEWLLAVHKPSGLLVHPTREAPDTTTCMQLARDQVGAYVYPVHRLDRGTSGVLLFCLDSASAGVVAAAFRERTVEKEYRALVRGWTVIEGTADGPIDGRPATTAFHRLATAEVEIPVGPFPTARYSLLEVRPRTGVRHQIRRHLRRLSHPLVGDVTYGDGAHNRMFRREFGVHRLVLLARELRLAHPVSGEWLAIRAAPDPELVRLFHRLNLAPLR